MWFRIFFAKKSSTYIVTDKMFGPFLSIDQISKLSEEKKRTLLKAILYSIVQLHDRGIVHSDLKPENILIRQTAAGFCTAKLIDFDSGFFEYEIPDEIIGDQRYFSPEAVLRNDEREKTPSDLFEGTALRTSFKREKTCPHCGKKLDGSPVFCPSCGERTADLKPLKETVCPYCESILTPGSSFCPACGKRIDTEYKPVHPAPAPSPRTSVPADSTTSGWSKPTDSDL